MSQFITLLKNDLRTGFNFNAFSSNAKKRNSKKKNSLIIPIILIMFLIALAFIYTLSITFMGAFIDRKYTGLYFGMGLGAILCLFMTAAKAYSTLFKAKDFELLFSMPISSKTILASKFVSLSIFGFGSFALFYLPAVVSYVFFFGFDVIMLMYSILTLFLVPMFLITLCSILSYLINRLLAKFKYQKILKSLFGIAFFIVYFVGIFSFSSLTTSIEGADTEYFTQMCDSLENIFSNIFYPSHWIVKAMEGEFWYYLIFAATSIIQFILFIIYVGKNFLKANISSNKKITNSKFVLKEQNENSAKFALFKKEFKTFISSSIYLMNCIIGPILSVIVTASLCVTLKDTLPEDIEFMSNLIPLLIIVVTSFIIGMVPTTSCSINFEGKRLWLIKSAPISTKDILHSKLLVYMVVSIPFVIINGVIANIMLDVSIIYRIALFVCPAILTTIYGIEGLLINTKSYRFDWKTEAEAIKQGTNTLWSMLASLAIFIIVLIPSIILTILNEIIGIIFMFGIGILFCWIMYLILMRHGIKSFDELPA